jgi:hypothetical protein
VVVGPLGDSPQYGLLKIDLETMNIEDEIRLQFIMVIKNLENTNTLLLPSVYLPVIYEVSKETLELKRIIKSDPNIYSIEYDQKRNLLYTSSENTGKFSVIDYRSGQTIKTVFIGNKLSPMTYDPTMDTLYLGSKNGLLK